MGKIAKQTKSGSKSSSVAKREDVGDLYVLSVGISQQLESSGFSPLAQCENNALAVRNCFLDYPSLGADAANVQCLTSKGTPVSRGSLISAVKTLAAKAGAGSRLLLYFSGHGHQVADKLYLVPEDAYDSEDPGALVDFEQLMSYLQISKATTKIVIFDANWAGPSGNDGVLHTVLTQDFWKETLGRSSNLFIVSAGFESNPTNSSSPDPQLSLFSYHLKGALSGTQEALNGTSLTLATLFEYVSQRVKAKTKKSSHAPVLFGIGSEAIILGDFTPALERSTIALDQSPIHSVTFLATQNMRVKEFLPNARKGFSPAYVSSQVNKQLAEHFEDELGRAVAELKNNFDFPEDDVEMEGAGIRFPGGRFWIEFEAENEKTGQVMKYVSFNVPWFRDLPGIAKVLKSLDVDASEVKLEMTHEINLKRVVPGLRANGWRLSSDLANRAELTQKEFRLLIDSTSLTFHGFPPYEMFHDSESSQSKLAASVLKLLPNS